MRRAKSYHCWKSTLSTGMMGCCDTDWVVTCAYLGEQHITIESAVVVSKCPVDRGCNVKPLKDAQLFDCVEIN